MRVLALLTLGLLNFGAHADDFEIGEKVVVSGNSYVCRSHDDWRLLWFAIDKNDRPAYRERMKSGNCGFVAEKEALTDCEFRGRLSTTAAVARCVTEAQGKQFLQDLYVSPGSLTPKHKPKVDTARETKFAAELADVMAEQKRMRADLMRVETLRLR